MAVAPPSHLPCSISWHFERDPIPYALETDLPVEGGGFEPPHFRIGIREDSPPMRRNSNLCISEFEFTETLNLGSLELAHLDADVGRVQRL